MWHKSNKIKGKTGICTCTLFVLKVSAPRLLKTMETGWSKSWDLGRCHTKRRFGWDQLSLLLVRHLLWRQQGTIPSMEESVSYQRKTWLGWSKPSFGVTMTKILRRVFAWCCSPVIYKRNVVMEEKDWSKLTELRDRFNQRITAPCDLTSDLFQESEKKQDRMIINVSYT